MELWWNIVEAFSLSLVAGVSRLKKKLLSLKKKTNGNNVKKIMRRLICHETEINFSPYVLAIFLYEHKLSPT